MSDDGQIVSIGAPEKRLFDRGSREARPQRVNAGARFASVFCGAHHSVALTGEGELWSWGWQGGLLRGAGGTGRRAVGHLRDPTPVDQFLPEGRRVVGAACGRQHTLAISGPLDRQTDGQQRRAAASRRGRSFAEVGLSGSLD
eukprot:Selendium_serpulae@DN6014_c1_g1_i7.p1